MLFRSEEILTKAPSAELAPGQKDEDSLPPYDILDPILYEFTENRKNVAQLANEGYDRALVEGVSAMMQKAEFKRSQAAPALHLSSRGFGREWRFPIAVRT